MINISNSTSKNKSSWLLEAPAGPDEPTHPSGLAGTSGAPGTAARRTRGRGQDGTGAGGLRVLAAAGRLWLSWLVALPGRLGDRLFAVNDTEAYWHDWKITKTRAGLGRSYRDPRFDLLAECPRCHGAGRTADLSCPPCLGTGRITTGRITTGQVTTGQVTTGRITRGEV